DVDVIGVEAAEAVFECAPQMIARGAAIVRTIAGGEIGLGGDQHAVALVSQSLGENFLRAAVGVAVGGVEEIDAASRQMSIRRAASATSVSPHALKNSLEPPNVAAPKLRAETLRPEPPRSRYSMAHWMRGEGRGFARRLFV